MSENPENIQLYIRGGLGNQLHQYAAARYIQKRLHAKNIIINLESYRTYKIRNVEIDKLLTKSKDLKYSVKSGFTFKVFRNLYHIYQKIYKTLTGKHSKQVNVNFLKSSYILTTVAYSYRERKFLKTVYMYGYFVSSEIALEMKSFLMNDIRLLTVQTPSYNVYKKDILEHNSIAISIRIGEDYKKNGWPICTRQYYIKALDRIQNGLHHNKVFIFADDISYIRCNNWFIDYDVVYVEGLEVVESFELLRYCNHYICSNSSFSWWAAFLSYNEDKIIIYPNKVFGGKGSVDDFRTFYPDLIRLDIKTGNLID